MMNKNVKGILALGVVTALSFGVIIGSKTLSENLVTGAETGETTVKTEELTAEELDASGAESIDSALKYEDGSYEVTVREKGYVGDIVMKVSFDADGETITGVSVEEQTETEGVGARITEEEFLSQFAGAKAPVSLPGMSAAAGTKETENVLEGAVLADGTYEAKEAQADDNGFVGQVNMTVADGKITEVAWDYITEDGTRKSVMSENGEYTMTEDGPTWKEQAEALAAALVENQSLNVFTMDEQGKTDAVSGVSISIGGFVSLAEDCMMQAAGVEAAPVAEAETPAEGTAVDAVSGATISSTAAVKGINDAFEFLNTLN